MISVEEARARILAGLHPVGVETVSLAQAAGRVLARDLHARRTQPPEDVSAMDGYALRAGDPGPWTVIGSAPAGHPFAGCVGPGQAVRLFTGSVVPEGADAIVIQEDVDRDGDRFTVRETPVAGGWIRRRGGDFAEGQALIRAGTRLGARAVGLAAASDHAWLTVHRRPRVAILATGDEIALPGDRPAPGGIVSSNAHALAALVASAGGEPVVLPIARDTIEATVAAAEQCAGMDLLLSTGGASVGEHDLVQRGLGERGFALDFWQIAMRPGKPLIFGRLGPIPVLGLPGNPVSAIVCALLFALPAIAHLSGQPGQKLPTATARLLTPLPANDRRADHLRARLATADDGELLVEPFPQQDSSQLRLLYEAQALVLRPPHAPPAPKGALVPILRLDLASI